MWTEIVSTSDIKGLLESYGNFHDSCIRDINISTMEFVDEKHAMHFSNILTATILFQRQSNKNAILELKFDGLKYLNYNPLTDGNYNVLLDAALRLRDSYFYWADHEDWEEGDNDAVWVCSKKLFWRFRPELIGNIQRVSDL